MTPADPIERKKTYELVAERLIGDIGARRLKPGDLLPTERELTGAYAVGRSSVREALRMLESQGFIREHESGAFVVSEFRPLNQSMHLLLALDEANVYEVYEMRKLLEGEFAALAAERRSEEDLGRMLTAVHDMAGALDSVERYIDADLRFHVAIAVATRNRVAQHLMHAIRDLLQSLLGSIFHIPGSPQSSVDYHRLILDAVAARKPDEARRLMIEHLDRVERDVRRALAGDGKPARA